MKPLYIWLLISGLGVLSPVFSQCDSLLTIDSVGISTDPRPGKAYNHEPGQAVNTFDWFGQNYLAPVNMYSNYSSQTAFSNPFYNNNSDLNYLAFGADSDFYPEDGWELIQWGFGMMVGGATEFSVSGHQRSVPILILYNRHSGMLHVFGAYNDFRSNVFQIELRFSDKNDANRTTYKPAGMLGYAHPIAQPLDQPTTVSSVKSRFPFPNDPIKFVHAAFPIAYDSCVATNQAAFRVYFMPIQTMDIELRGRLAATSHDPLEAFDGLSHDYDVDYLNSVYTDGTEVIAGVQVSREAKRMYDELMAEMTAKGEIDIVAALDVLKAGLELGAELTPDLKAELIVADINFGDPLKVAAKGINYAQSIIKFRKSLDPPKPSLSPPAIIRGEISMSGTIHAHPNPQQATEFAVPGSQGSDNLPEAGYTNQPYYPLYNEQLGVFALLETPVVERYRSVSTSTLGICYDPPGGPPSLEEETIEAFSYRLATPLKYALNPAARIDLSRSDISVALVIKNRPLEEDSYGGNGSYYAHEVSLGNLEEGPDPYTYLSPFLPVECLESLTLYLDNHHFTCDENWYGP